MTNICKSYYYWLLKSCIKDTCWHFPIYIPRGDYHGATLDHNLNYVLWSIYRVKDVIRRRFQWSIGTWDRISLWNYPWPSNVECISFGVATYHRFRLNGHNSEAGNMELINGFFLIITQPYVFLILCFCFQ